MILVTVGTQLGFDRLIEAMDGLAINLEVPVIAQVGNGKYNPRHLTARSRIEPGEFEQMVQAASILVGHAGTGTILTAAKFRKPLVLLPRRASFGEHRNDHQIATAHAFANRPGIFVAMCEDELSDMLNLALDSEYIDPPSSRKMGNIQQSLKLFIGNPVI